MNGRGPQVVPMLRRPWPLAVSQIAKRAVEVAARTYTVRALVAALFDKAERLVVVEDGAIKASAEALALADELEAAAAHLADAEASLRAILTKAGAR